MNNFTKIVRPGTTKNGDVFAKISFTDGNLSISGVIRPLHNGDARGSCGQILMDFKEYDERGHASVTDIAPAPKWTHKLIKQFFDTWSRWHLNDLKAGSAAQEQYLRDHPIPQSEYAYPKSHYDVASAKLAAAGLNPDADGYRYGSAWKREAVPADVIEFLRSLPDTDKQPAWI